MTLAPEKIQALMISWSPAAKPVVEMDQELRFNGHIKDIAQKASHRVTALRRVAGFFDKGDKLLLYKAQIRSYLEYAALVDVVYSLTHQEAGQHPVSSPTTGGCCRPHPPSSSQQVPLTHWNTAGTSWH